MTSIYYCFFLILLVTQVPAQSAWQPVPGKISSPWANQVQPSHVLAEYPRPQMERKTWMNLNGLWDYAITDTVSATSPQAYAGKILVPFAVESSLSGVGRTVGASQWLWYHRTFRMPDTFRGQQVLLHFGAVDWRCEVWINGQPVGRHEGGYDPFSFNISPWLKGNTCDVKIKVWDPSDDGPQPRGKQVKQPGGIWYTPVTGIWQTVWLEAVPATYIQTFRQTPSLRQGKIYVSAQVAAAKPGDQLRLSAYVQDQPVATITVNQFDGALTIPQPHRWTPDDPFLYELRLEVLRRGKPVDVVRGYFALRDVTIQQDEQGVQRMLLNGEPVFQYGPLDQGWWPDGLYTAPTEEALKFDIEKTKAMGFNMIRKHVKVEPARWYYHCDRLGLLVWQDMPSGDMGNEWEARPSIIGIGTDKVRTARSEQIYRTEWKAIIDATYNFPCIVVWVPFNEAWGQFKTRDITQWTQQYDTTRLVNSASGGNYAQAGHLLDLHNYPNPAMPDPAQYGDDYVIVLGEFGGLGLPVEGHTWQEKDNWGYQRFATPADLEKRYAELMSRLNTLIDQGLSAAVYTQTTDVEVEVNGLMTYDRRVMKIPEDHLKRLHAPLYGHRIRLRP